MIEMLLTSWVFWAIISSLMVPVTLLYVEFKSPDTHSAVFWRGLGAGIVLLPVIFLFHLEADIIFWISSLIASCLSVYASYTFMQINKEHGSGITSRVFPLASILTFILATLISPTLFKTYLQNSTIFIGLLLCICASVFFGLKINKCTISRIAYKKALPSLCLISCTSIIMKFAFEHANDAGALYYALIQSWVIAFMTLFFNKEDKKIARFSFRNPSKALNRAKKHTLFGLIFGLIVSFATIARGYSFHYADNVSYPMVLSLMSSFWILIAYKAIGHKENVAIWPGIGIVISAIVLTILTGQLHK